MRHYYIFIMLNVFIFPCLFIGTIDSLVQLFSDDPFVSLSRINFALQGAFFINWLIQQAFLGAILKLYRFMPFFKHKWAMWNAVSDREKDVARRITGTMMYRSRFSHLLLAVTILLAFSIIVPLVAPAATLFFIIIHIVDKNNILHVYAKEPNNEEIIPAMLYQFLASLLVYEIAILAFFFIKKVLFGFIVALIVIFFSLVLGFYFSLRNEWDQYTFVRYYEPDLIPWAYPESLLRTAYCHPGFVEEEDDLENRVNRHLDDIDSGDSSRRVDIVDDVFGDEYDQALLDWETKHNQDQDLKGAHASKPNPDYVPPSHSRISSPPATTTATTPSGHPIEIEMEETS